MVGRYDYDLYFDNIETEEEINSRQDLVDYFLSKYEELSPDKVEVWKTDVESKFKSDTQEDKLFRVLFENLNEKVASCNALPDNTNPQKQVQNLREKGLCVITECERGVTYIRLLEGIRTYGFESEKIPEEIRMRTLRLFSNIDALSGNQLPSDRLIIEHKFPEERWKGRPAENNINMTDEEIKNKFQLLTSQYNQIKREACKKCARFRKRQAPFNITYFYEGDEEWSCDYEFGPEAEDGCIGCGWYDVVKWKKSLITAANREDLEDGEDK